MSLCSPLLQFNPTNNIDLREIDPNPNMSCLRQGEFSTNTWSEIGTEYSGYEMTRSFKDLDSNKLMRSSHQLQQCHNETLVKVQKERIEKVQNVEDIGQILTSSTSNWFQPMIKTCDIQIENDESEEPTEFYSSSDWSKDLEDSNSSSLCSLLRNDMSDESMSMSFGSQSNESSLGDKNEELSWEKGEYFKERQKEEKASEHSSEELSKNFDLSFEQLQISPEIIFRFQLPSKDSADTLLKDFNALKLLGQQSSVVNEQLEQLYAEIESESILPNEMLEDEGTSSSGNESSASETNGERRKSNSKKMVKIKWRKYNYGKYVTVYEENAPMPSHVRVSIESN